MPDKRGARGKLAAALADSNRRLADYAMVVDLAGVLAKVTTEAEAVERLFGVFTALFAPAKLIYIPVLGGRPGAVQTRPAALPEGQTASSRWAEDGAEVAWREEASGFRLRIGLQGETLGILDVEGVALPQHKERYLNLALAVRDVCGLAISNARKYEEIKRMEELLSAERERLAVTLHSIGEGVVATDTAARVILVNEVAERLTGWAQEEAAGRHLDEVFRLVNGSTGKPLDSPVGKALDTGLVVEQADDTVLIARDGAERTIANSGAPIRNRTGDVLGVVLAFRDVTEQKKTERALYEANRSLKTVARIVENSPDMISVLDRRYVYRMINPPYCKMFGRPASEIDGHPIWEFVGEETFQSLLRPKMDRCFAGESVRYEDWLTLPAVGRRYLDVHYYPLFGEGGVEHIVIVARDITERQQTEQLREDYINIIGHDLRNPLTSISGTAQWLQRSLAQKDLEQERVRVQAILTSAKRINSLVQDLIESARLESGQLELQQEPTDLLGLVLDTVERTGTPEDRLRIRVEAPEPVPPIMADPQYLERAIVNLLTNGLKYSPADKPVVIRLAQDASQAEISVADQGSGIRGDALPRVFDRYYRVPDDRRVEGLGLGLYITRLIVEAHGGHVYAESQLEKGSTFYITLPLPAQETAR